MRTWQLSIAVALAVMCGSCGGQSTADKPKPTAQQLNDAKYLDDTYDANGVVSCGSGADDYLRSIAKYDFAWDDEAKGFGGLKFDRYNNMVSSPGVLVMVSDRAKLQNGFGAFQRITLYCRYDTQADKVLGYAADTPND